jgi:NADH-quinone oxidoreductase subunit J
MPEPLFLFFALLTLIFGIGVVVNRNPVASGLCLVVSFIGLAAIYVSLNAYFLGTIQVLVYAGAVMVLFLFIIMLLDIKAETRRKMNKTAVIGGASVTIGFLAMLANVISNFNDADKPLPAIGADKANASDVTEIGNLLFTNYTLHLQIVGVLLLVATIGVVVLSRREDRPALTKTADPS